MPRKSSVTTIPTLKPVVNKFTVIRDTREKPGQGWDFPKSPICEGTIIKYLPTGDYSLLGLEDKVSLERKRNSAEFAQNILEDRFERELVRLESFEFPFLILEFSMSNLMQWPLGSGLPPSIQRKTRITKAFLLKRFIDLELQYKTRIILAGLHGKEVAYEIFKRMNKYYGQTL